MYSAKMALEVRSSYSVTIPDDIQSFPRMMLQKFENHADKVAIVDSVSGQSYTYRQLKLMITKCGSALLRRGFKQKDVLAIILPNIPEYPAVLYGVISIGGTATTLNPMYTVNELAYQLEDSGASYVITTPQLVEKVNAAAGRAGSKEVLVFGNAEGFESFSNLVLSDDGSLFQICDPMDWQKEVVVLPYSSGTTGLPKGIMFTHYNMIAHNIIGTHKAFLFAPENGGVLLGLLPFYHSFGLECLLGFALFCGCKIVCMTLFKEEAFLKVIQDYKVDTLCIVPPLALFLAKNPLVNKFDLTCVERIICGAAPLAGDLMQQLKERLSNTKIIRNAYGLTETALTCSTSTLDLVKPGSIGSLLPNLKAKVIDLKSGVLLGPEQDGEICVAGPNVMKGYLNKPDATAKTIDKDGWLHTGDIGHYDRDGYFYIVDRVKELIKYKGFQVPPAELESVLLSHPQISDAAVVGVPNLEAGELPKAFVVTRSKMLSEKEIMDFVAKKVAPHKKLRGGVERVESIPKNASGKIMRRQLREQERKKM